MPTDAANESHQTEERPLELVPLSRAVYILRERNPGIYLNRRMLETAIEQGKIGFLPIGARKIVDIKQVTEYLEKVCLVETQGQTSNRKRPAQ